MFLLDTDAISALRRPTAAPAGLIAWATDTPASDLYISAISVYEIDRGVREVERRDQVQGEALRAWLERGILANFRDRILSLDTAIAMKCAELNGPGPKLARDSFIAATALVHRLELVTGKEREFAGLGVKIFNPWRAEGRSVTEDTDRAAR